MKAVILAGGFGTRISEESQLRPKPMIEIGGRPILWHIMKYFSKFGVNDFIILGGYRVDFIREYFLKYRELNSDFTLNLTDGKLTYLSNLNENWNVTILDSGLNAMTGGRLLSAKSLLQNEENFFFTYGDGLSDIDLNKQLEFHRNHGKIATLAAVRPPERFGKIGMSDTGCVHSFQEKPENRDTYINGGFFILKPQAISYINDVSTTWEREPLEILASEGQLMAYKHDGFWRPMDTLKDKNDLEKMWIDAPAWKVW